ncbi:hypothetical protein AGIG_G25285 [Arapaima gigas]
MQFIIEDSNSRASNAAAVAPLVSRVQEWAAREAGAARAVEEQRSGLLLDSERRRAAHSRDPFVPDSGLVQNPTVWHLRNRLRSKRVLLRCACVSCPWMGQASPGGEVNIQYVSLSDNFTFGRPQRLLTSACCPVFLEKVTESRRGASAQEDQHNRSRELPQLGP